MRKNVLKKFSSTLVSGSLILTSVMPQCSVLAMNEKDDNDNSDNENNNIDQLPQKGVDWDYDENSKTLTIMTDKAMVDYDIETDQPRIRCASVRPWDKIRDIESIIIKKSVTKIGDADFLNSYDLSNIVFENGSQIKKIGRYAFCHCTQLPKIVIPSNVEVIEEKAFYGCLSLYSVTFEKNSKLVNIKHDAFGNCPELSTITNLPNSTNVANDAFERCDNLNSEIKEHLSNLYRLSSVMPHRKAMNELDLSSINIPKSAEVSKYAFSNTKLKKLAQNYKNKLKKVLISVGIFLTGIYLGYKFSKNK